MRKKMTFMRQLRIAITTDPEIPVPPTFYGGIERKVDMLVRGLGKRGHDVTLFAHPDSRVPCRLAPYPGCSRQATRDVLRNMWEVSFKVLRGRYDLVHIFGRLVYVVPLLPLRIPKLLSYGGIITPRSVAWGERLARGSLHFTGLSHQMISPYKERANWHVVYNGVPIDTYDFREAVDADAPLVFLGRLDEIKGPHVAIEVARRCGRRLVIAGGPNNHTYFQEKIAPHIDGKAIQYLGPVTDRQKNALLGRAAALLMPILWEEPFGMVMAEALACGTPVIALNRGSVPEVVQHGVNGFVCESIEEMVEAVSQLKDIDRGICRQVMEEKFSDRVIVAEYEKLYMQLIGNGPAR